MIRSALRIGTMLAVLCALAAGCGNWARTGGPFEQPDHAVVLPDGWFRLKGVGDLLLTRDGPPLQTVTITSRAADAPFRNTKRRMVEGMHPLEAAEAFLDDLLFDEELLQLEVMDSRPAVVGDEPGFRISLAFRDHQGVARRSVRYGVLRGGRFFSLRYDAAERHYFDRDLAAFEDMVSTFVFP